jgi:phosphatidylserine decarboxylase
MILSEYGKREWLTILAIGVMLTATFLYVGLWWIAILVVIADLALLSFFRDPERRTPSQRGMVTSPADGKISSIHDIQNFEPLGEDAVCVRIFLSVADVHVNRSPLHGIVASVTHKPGDHLNALNPQSAEVNESVMIVLHHPIRRYPVAAVRQVAGLIARTIVCATRPEQILQRGQRYGMIKMGSTTELYLPVSAKPQILVQQGQMVKGGLTVLAKVISQHDTPGTPGS